MSLKFSQIFSNSLSGESRTLPQQCECGANNNRFCNQTGLKNHWNFPPFINLPDEYDIDEDYYVLDTTIGCYMPFRHWVLFGEIEQNLSDFIRARVEMKSRFGERFIVHFHLEDAEVPAFFGCHELRPGSTIAIFYPYVHEFMDLSTGIRQTNSRTAMVFPASFEILAIEYDFIRGATQSPDTCCVCHGRSASPIKRCKNCKLATYCSKDCQVIHWKKSHKKFCSKYSGILSRLSKIDFSDFQSHYDWNFVAPSDLEIQITTL